MIGAQKSICQQAQVRGSRGSKMHCSVGFAILVKVAAIWVCFDAGTQSFSMVGTPVSLMPRSSASRRSGSSTAATAWSCRQPQTASGCAQRSTIWGAHNRMNSPRGSGSFFQDQICACAELPKTTARRMAASELVRIIVPYFSGISLGQARSVAGDDGEGRRAIVGECADARQAAVGRTSYRGAGQNEGKTQDEADGPHWLSPVSG